MVPPDCLEPVLKAIINNFVTERNSSEVKGVIGEENNLFVLLHDNEVWVKVTAGNVVKKLFAKRAYKFGDIVNVIWSSS